MENASNKTEKRFICTVCGYIHEGSEPPQVCPICGVASDMFEEDE